MEATGRDITTVKELPPAEPIQLESQEELEKRTYATILNDIPTPFLMEELRRRGLWFEN